MATDGVGD